MPGRNSHITDIPGWLIPCCFLFYLVVNVISWNFPFFWDSLLTSTITTWFYENGWNGGVTPTAIDAGHPPFFYAYLLGWWKIMDRSLLFSHLAILPFLWILVYQFTQLTARLVRSSHLVIVAVVLFCLETTILAQSTAVSYDIVMLCFYLFALRYILDKKPVPVAFASIVLCLISLRGVVGVAALMVTEWLISENRDKRIQNLVKYLPALLLFGLWNLWHLNATGWMLFTPSDHWEQQRGFTDINGLLKNAIAILRVHLEPGRLLLYIIIGIGLMQYFLLPSEKNMKRIVLITSIPFALFSIFFLPFTNPIGHRYFMIVFALSIPLFVAITQNWRLRKLAWMATALVLISGHFWIYPSPVSNGWDSSLGHLAYFKADRQMKEFLESNLIAPSQIAAHFPSDVSGDQSHLNEKMERPVEIEKTDSIQYIIHSNISNDFTEEELQLLKDRCTALYKVKNKWIRMTLYNCGE